KIYLHTANSDDQSKQTIINEYLTKWSGVATSDNLSVITGTPILYVGLNKDNTIYMSNAGGPALTMPLDEKDSKGIKYYAWATPSNIPHVFWSSSKPESVYVDQDGIVTFKQKPASGEKVTVTVKSMYDSNAIYGEYTVVFDDFAFEGLKYRILDEANCAVTRPADRNITAVSIPEETDNGYKVVQIDNNAFQGCTAIKNAVISSSVNNVGKFAFDHCTGMTNLTLNEGLASIQWGAFISVGITKLVVPSTVTTFAGNNFQNCPNLQSVILPNTLTSLGGNFHGCAKLSDVLLPTSLKTIGTGTFRGCGLTEIALPPNVTTLGSNAFYGCKNLERVYMGPKVTQIGVNAFSGNDNLTEIYITSQTAPTLVNNNAFNFKTSPTLYVQGQSTISKYSAWQNNFAAIRAMVDTHEDVEIRVGTISKTTMRADSNTGKENFSTESHIYALAGDNFSRSATTVLKDSDTQASIPHTFWSSTDPGKVYVDNTGAITVKNNIEMAQPVTLNLQTLYDNGPTHTIIVENYHMTGVEEILGDDADGYGLQWNEPAQIFTLSGLSAGYSLNNLSPGIYIVKQGGEAFKITVR
ncbi:MAG: leucine-rich repeat domain-containing protein, partial [Bacteroidales bacterium]|nr:leucine-rich repeat domain-containing protein [Bacteroidales bacterium]